MNQYRVNEGIKLLDAHDPDWYLKVTSTILNINDPTNCVLSQVFGGFLTGCMALGIVYNSMPFGFCASKANYEEVTNLWNKVILEKRNNRSSILV